MSVPPTVPPFLGSHELLLLLLQLGILLLAALVLGRLAARLRLPALVGELAAGILLGPSVLAPLVPALSSWLFPARAGQFHLLDAVGQLGVLLLVGITGTQLDLGLIRARSATVARISGFGLVIPFALGAATGMLLPAWDSGTGDRSLLPLFLGVAMSVSAVPVIAKTLMDMKLLHHEIGQLTLTAGVIDDVFGWLMLSVLSAMATAGVGAGSVLRAVVGLLALLAVAALFGGPVMRRIFRWAGRSGEPGPPVAAMVGCVILTAAVTASLGLEAIFGAFLCGILISRHGKPDPAAVNILRTVVNAVLAPLFFATVGLRMDLTALTDPRWLAVAAVVLSVAMAGKFSGAYLGARTSRMTGWEGLALGAGMNARGVVEVVVAMVGLRLGIISAELYTIIVLLAVATSLVAPPVLRLAMARVDAGPSHASGRPAHPKSPVVQKETT
uniref:Cation:proton antiporter n=1 Tax=Streptomyces sp. NBC_00049 TaxID=2903617 RepID=A0AAU2K4T5_9ACTN